eukprot:m.343894 g.343894  ORF g.343894 m.343894 type:complete len:429 (+) comp20637_c0_seq2:94-1380(+)
MSGFKRRVKGNNHSNADGSDQEKTELSAAVDNSNPASSRGTSRLPPGTRPSRRGGAQLITPTGLPAFDALLGGGVAIGSTLLLREDLNMRYARVLSKLFLSQGFATDQGIALASAERSPKDVFKILYAQPRATDMPSTASKPSGSTDGGDENRSSDAVSLSATGTQSTASDSVEDPMHIAWRYQNVKRVQSEIGGSCSRRNGGNTQASLGINFDISATVDATTQASPPVCHIDLRDPITDGTNVADYPFDADGSRVSRMVPVHQHLYDRVHTFLDDFQGSADGNQHRIARVVIETLDSPLMSGGSGIGSRWAFSVVQLVHRIRTLVRNRLAVCLVTVQGSLMPSAVFGRLLALSDTAVELEGFAGAANEASAALREYHGFFRILKLPRINSLSCFLPDTLDLAFKLKRRKFVIEKLHLPPDMSETVSR